MKGAKVLLNRFLTSTTGYHLASSNKGKLFDFLTSSWVKSLKIDGVVDVGGNTGQFAQRLLSIWPTIPMVSFEPDPLPFAELLRLQDSYGSFKAENCALGREEGNASFFRSGFSPTSSLMEPTDEQLKHFPKAQTSGVIEVIVSTLDQMLINHLVGTERLLLKIDVQGFEKEVLLGATETLRRVSLIYIELSFVEYYQGQPLFDEVYRYMVERGFEFRGVVGTLQAGDNHEPTQVDAVFLNTSINQPNE